MAATSDDGRQELVEQFCAITGSEIEVGQRMIEACNGNLEMAIGMHMDAETADTAVTDSVREGGAVPQASCSSAAMNPHAQQPQEEIRAPIPQKQEVLVEETSYGFGGLRGRRRPARSVFDGFRDFQAETRQQELQRAGTSAVNKKRKTLEDLFRPPIELMHKGSFHSARDVGAQRNKWLMVNIQNVQEFSCQALNRDLWSNGSVRALIKENFIFWQVYHDSEEGRKYVQFYPVVQWPYIAVLDPRTGENLVVWTKVDPVCFCDLVTDFLAQHPPLDGSGSTSPPAKKARTELERQSSIVDASEDSQLEAAIKASLEETTAQSAATQAKKYTYADTFSGSDLSDDDLETFSDSDTDGQASPVKAPKLSQGKQLQTKAANPVLHKDSRSSSTACKNGFQGNTTNCSQGTSKKVTFACGGATPEVPQEKDTEKEPQSECRTEIAGSWQDHLGSAEDPRTDIMVRFPDGEKKKFTVPCSSKLRALVQFVSEQGYPDDKFEMCTNFPRRKLTCLDLNTSLKEAGLFPQDTVFVHQR